MMSDRIAAVSGVIGKKFGRVWFDDRAAPQQCDDIAQMSDAQFMRGFDRLLRHRSLVSQRTFVEWCLAPEGIRLEQVVG